MTPEGGEEDMTTMQHQPGASINGMVPEGWYTTGEAAELVGKSRDTLARYRREEIFIPSGEMMAGKIKVNLYSEDDIKSLRELIKTIRPGRKRQSEE